MTRKNKKLEEIASILINEFLSDFQRLYDLNGTISAQKDREKAYRYKMRKLGDFPETKRKLERIRNELGIAQFEKSETQNNLNYLKNRLLLHEFRPYLLQQIRNYENMISNPSIDNHIPLHIAKRSLEGLTKIIK